MRVRREVLRVIEAHARRDGPLECCGLLVGDQATIVEAVPCANVASNPATRYVIAPEAFFDQIRRCRSLGGGIRVVGAYHSHVHSAPVPSPTDTADAFSGFLYLIAGPVDGRHPFTVHAYELTEGNLQPAILVPDPEEYDS